MFNYGIADCGYRFFRFPYPLTPFHAHIAGYGFGPPIDLPHPALQERGLSGLPGRVEYPIEFIPYIPVQLSPHQPFLRRKHIVHLRTAGTGGIKKTYPAFFHTFSITRKGSDGRGRIAGGGGLTAGAVKG
jgi:hypothetical protein